MAVRNNPDEPGVRGSMRRQLPNVRGVLLGLAVIASVSACGILPVDFAEHDPGPRAAGEAGPIGDGPPPVVVTGENAPIALEAWTYCFGTACVDGMPPAQPADVGSPAVVIIEFPLDDWSFEAEFVVTAGGECPRRQSVPVEQTAPGQYLLEPAGHADAYDVTLFGRGDGGGGDLFVTFRWTTPADGPMPLPEARIAVLADHDGQVDSYGIELELSDLAVTPREASAEVTVTAADGESLSFSATRAPGCMAEGTVYWDGPDEAGLRAAMLGPAPFTYLVEVVLYGTQHAATAAWPGDQIAGYEPSVSLEFDPPLPALTGSRQP